MSIERLQSLLFAGRGASVDTRTLCEGEVFFALPGQNHHGALFASEALQKGASLVVLPEGWDVPSLPPDRVCFHPEPLTLLGEMAAAYRKRFTIPVVAVGGSNGKTTTKALLAHLLSAHAPTLASPRSWNNAIGVPLTLLRMQAHHAFAVIEIGDNHPGEVSILCQIAQPTIGIITNIGADHLEGYGSIEANLAAKWEMVEYLAGRPGAHLFLNGEDALLTKQPLPPSLSVTYFGAHPQSPIQSRWIPLSYSESLLELSVAGKSYSVTLPFWGSFNRLNVEAAILVALHLGVAIDTILTVLPTFRPEAYRSQVLSYREKTVILDAYNANPSSLRASLSALRETLREGDKVAIILGQMEELGAFAEQAHKEAIAWIEELEPFLIGAVFVGKLWKGKEIRLSVPYLHLERVEELHHQNPRWLESASVIYLKGSRAAALEKWIESAEGGTRTHTGNPTRP